jgi:K+ transporter
VESLILWALFLVVTAKYVFILLRADNRGEGGTLSLMALAQHVLQSERSRFVVLLLGIAAASLFYGDALLTPAISVLSAVEGLEVAAPHLASFVVPVTVAILIALFAVQSRGTQRVARYFGPIMMVWFLTLAMVGTGHIADDPGILHAVNPLYVISGLSPSVPYSWPSPVLRRYTPTLGTSDASQFRLPGPISYCHASPSITSARVRWYWLTPAPLQIPFIILSPIGPSTR